MAIFGRGSARQRMRRATQQALSVPTFRTPADCTPWVLGGLWPAELELVTPEIASVAEHLKNDLQRIATSANGKLRAISEAGLMESARQAEETRIINVARAFAVLRVESTVRQLRGEPLGFQPEYLSLGGVSDVPPVEVVSESDRPDGPGQLADSAKPVETIEHVEPGGEDGADEADEADEAIESAETDGAQAIIEAVQVNAPAPARPTPQPLRPEPRSVPLTTASPDHLGESADHRLRRLVEYVARQEPGLRWAVGDRADGTTVLVTDLANGWIPSGIELPAAVELLPPGRRSGNLAALLGPTELAATYRPGDPFTGATVREVTVPSEEVRAISPVDDLGWQLTDATHWRDGLPRMVHTMAKAGAAGTGVVDAELDILRVHLDTARYQLFAQYPEVDDALLCNCLLLAATEALAIGSKTAAHYHFGWFLELTAATAGGWGSTQIQR